MKGNTAKSLDGVVRLVACKGGNVANCKLGAVSVDCVDTGNVAKSFEIDTDAVENKSLADRSVGVLFNIDGFPLKDGVSAKANDEN